MTPTEFRQIRLSQRLSVRALASLLGVSERSVRRWEGGYDVPDEIAAKMKDIG